MQVGVRQIARVGLGLAALVATSLSAGCRDAMDDDAAGPVDSSTPVESNGGAPASAPVEPVPEPVGPDQSGSEADCEARRAALTGYDEEAAATVEGAAAAIAALGVAEVVVGISFDEPRSRDALAAVGLDLATDLWVVGLVVSVGPDNAGLTTYATFAPRAPAPLGEAMPTVLEGVRVDQGAAEGLTTRSLAIASLVYDASSVGGAQLTELIQTRSPLVYATTVATMDETIGEPAMPLLPSDPASIDAVEQACDGPG